MIVSQAAVPALLLLYPDIRFLLPGSAAYYPGIQHILSCESDATGIFNIACGRRITVNELVILINEVLGKEIKSIHADPRAGDIKHSLADISRARDFGYEPKGNFKDELAEVVGWFVNKSA